MKTLWKWGALSLAALAPLASPLAAQDGCQGGDRVVPVHAWGQPRTTFSSQPATTHAEVQAQFARYEKDLREVLALAGYQGSADDLFKAVREAREGDGTITAESFPSRSEFEWMAFRKKGKPACVRNVIWAADKPFAGWKIKVESGGWEYTFALPQDCLNLAFQKGEKRPLPPTCELTASFDAEANRITVRGTTDGTRLEITSASGPSGAIAPGALTSGGAGTWSLEPSADGRYEFTAVATSESGVETTCRAGVDVRIKRPVCRIDASADPETGAITVDTSGSEGAVELTGMTMADGSEGSVSALSGGAGRWSYAPTVPKKPGDYSFGFSAVARLHGFEAECEDTAVITRAAWSGRWIVRGYVADINPKDSQINTLGSVGIPEAPPEATQFTIDSGSGFGFGVEYLATPRVGVELDLLFSDVETEFMYDQPDLWLMAEDDFDFRPASLGVNFHLTPGKRFDLYVGPFVSLVEYGDVSFSFPLVGRVFSGDFDDDTGFGAKLGFDLPFGWTSPWLFTSNLRYMTTSADPQNANAAPYIAPVDLDPWILTAGIGYRF